MTASVGSVEYWAERFPDRVALAGENAELTYAQWNAAADSLAEGLTRKGIVQGDVVAVRMSNRVEWPVVSAALSKLGASLLGLNTRLTAAEATYILVDSRAKALLLDDADPSGFVAGLSEAALSLVVAIDAGPHGLPTYGDLMVANPPARFAESDPALLIYTSGTTGRPKGVFQPSRPPWTIEPTGDVVLVTMPLHHASAPNQIWAARSAGRKIVLLKKFNPEEALALIDRHKVTFWWAVPTMCQRISILPAEVLAKYEVSSIENLSLGAAPVPHALKEWVIGYFGDDCLHEGYGTTETSMVTDLAPRDQLSHPGSSGQALPGVKISIRDADGVELPVNAEGEIWVRTPTTISNYLNAPPLGRDALDPDGFLKTGDVGRLDAEGHLYITGRSKDMIVAGGVNIYPAEIEVALNAHPDVIEAAVIGIPDEDFGEVPLAFVELKPNARATPAELSASIKDVLASYKRPKNIEILSELPRNPMGKILKTELREPYWVGRERSI